MNFSLNELLVFLALFTISVVVIWAYVGKKRTEKRMQDGSIPKSTLAKDAPDTRQKTKGDNT